ncbi:MAG: hypothetical protein OXF66_11095 [Gammaproteobacteria bacterium]|nr:hypothetical protein [Gammaproteobacteria bacterium]
MQQGDTLPPPPKYRLPPERSAFQSVWIWTAKILIFIGSLVFAITCVQLITGFPDAYGCICFAYIALILVLVGIVVENLFCYRERVFKKRVEDRSQVQWLLQEAESFICHIEKGNRSSGKMRNPNRLKKELERLKCLGPQCWTEYQILPLDCLLADFFPLADLKARALSGLAELREYAVGAAFSYDVNLYYEWEKRINSIIERIEDYEMPADDSGNANSPVESEVGELRANLRSLREHIADYQFNWARGSTIVSSIRVCGSVGVVVFLLLGLLPVLSNFSDMQSSTLGILDWGFLGAAGAMAGILLGLRNSDEVEVGNTEGEKELWRAVLGIPLGLLSGILAYAALKGGIIKSGAVVPELDDPSASDLALSIVWAVVSGLGLERIFERVRGAADL